MVVEVEARQDCAWPHDSLCCAKDSISPCVSAQAHLLTFVFAFLAGTPTQLQHQLDDQPPLHLSPHPTKKEKHVLSILMECFVPYSTPLKFNVLRALTEFQSNSACFYSHGPGK